MTLTRDERDRFASTTPSEIAYSEGACVETPPKLFELLHSRYKFDVDLTANEQNHLLPYWFGPGQPQLSPANPLDWSDALALDWQQAGIFKAGFSNPPYGPFIPKILKKAIAEREKGFTSVFLLPMRAAGWFRDLVLPYYSELWYCSERIVFHYQGKPRLAANVKPTRALRADPQYQIAPDGRVLSAIDGLQRTWADTWGQPWSYEFARWTDVQEPARALFDSIIVVFAPYNRSEWGLFPPPRRPNIWEVKTGELRF